jgi:hypothetical protein
LFSLKEPGASASGILIFASLPAAAQNVEKAPPGGNYKR